MNETIKITNRTYEALRLYVEELRKEDRAFGRRPTDTVDNTADFAIRKWVGTQ